MFAYEELTSDPRYKAAPPEVKQQIDREYAVNAWQEISASPEFVQQDAKAQEKVRLEFSKRFNLEPPEGGFIASAKQAVGATIRGAGQLAADSGLASQENPVKRYGQSVIDANQTAIRGLSDIPKRPLKTVAEATGNAAGSMGGMIGMRAFGQGVTALAPFTGPAAPIVAAVGQGISWLGPMAIAALPSYGGIREKQVLNDPQAVESGKAKAIAMLGAATVGAIETKFGPQNWALAAMTKEGRAELAKKFASTTITGSVGKGAVGGAAIEGAEELVQSPVEQVASFDDPTTKESLAETGFGGAMGTIGGGVMGGAMGGAMGGLTRGQAEPAPIEQPPQPQAPVEAPPQQEPDFVGAYGRIDEKLAGMEDKLRPPAIKPIDPRRPSNLGTVAQNMQETVRAANESNTVEVKPYKSEIFKKEDKANRALKNRSVSRIIGSPDAYAVIPVKGGYQIVNRYIPPAEEELLNEWADDAVTNQQPSTPVLLEAHPESQDFAKGEQSRTAYQEHNGIGYSEYMNPDNGSVDTFLAAFGDNDFVGYMRVYENGKPTNRFTSKLEIQSGRKGAAKEMLSKLAEMLPEGHEYTENDTISTDGIRHFQKQIRNGYIPVTVNGDVQTSTAILSGASKVDDLGIGQTGDFTNLQVNSDEDFKRIQGVVSKLLYDFGLDESNVRRVGNQVEVDMPVLRKYSQENTSTSAQNDTPTQPTPRTMVDPETKKQDFRGNTRIPKEIRDAVLKMESDLKNGGANGVIVSGKNNDQTVTGSFPSTNPTWFKNESIKAYDAEHGTKYAGSVDRLSIDGALRKVRAGKSLDSNKKERAAWEYIQAAAEIEAQNDPELIANREFSKLEQEGFEFEAPEQISVGSLNQGDEVVVIGKNGIPDKLTHKGRENGNIVLQDGVRMEVDEFDQIETIARKDGKQEPITQEATNDPIPKATNPQPIQTTPQANPTDDLSATAGVLRTGTVEDTAAATGPDVAGDEPGRNGAVEVKEGTVVSHGRATKPVVSHKEGNTSDKDASFTRKERSPGNGPDRKVLTDKGLEHVWNKAAEEHFPGIKLGKKTIEAIQLIHSHGDSGLSPSDVKRGYGDTFHGLSMTRKDRASLENESIAAMSGDMQKRREIQEDNALIIKHQDEDTYKETYHLSRLGRKVMEKAGEIEKSIISPDEQQAIKSDNKKASTNDIQSTDPATVRPETDGVTLGGNPEQSTPDKESSTGTKQETTTPPAASGTAPATASETAGVGDGVEFDPLDLLMNPKPTTEADVAEQKAVVDGLKNDKFYKMSLKKIADAEKQIETSKAVIDDWSSRQYKENKAGYDKTDIYGQDGGRSTFGAANERRRRRNIDLAKMTIDENQKLIEGEKQNIYKHENDIKSEEKYLEVLKKDVSGELKKEQDDFLDFLGQTEPTARTEGTAPPAASPAESRRLAAKTEPVTQKPVTNMPDVTVQEKGERKNAEKSLKDLIIKKLKNGESVRHDIDKIISGMTDKDLAESMAEYAALPDGPAKESVSVTESVEKNKTLSVLAKRARIEISDAEDELESKHGITVRDDGIIEVYSLGKKEREIIGDLPIVVYHHTSTGIAGSIVKQGLRKGDKNVNLNTPDALPLGVYVTLMQSGADVELYGRAAKAIHGGDPLIIEVKTRIDDLQQDTDDEDIQSGNYQYVLESVSVKDILNMDEINQSSKQPAQNQAPTGKVAEGVGSESSKIVEHTTQRGKVLRGIIATGITVKEAREIDPYTFKKDGGFFIREDKLNGAEIKSKSPVTEPQENKPEEKKPVDKSAATAKRLRTVAEKLKESATDKLNQDRQTNTVKRAREAGQAEDAARKDIKLSETMLNIANAIESGEAKHLSGITAKTQVELLNSLLNQAKYKTDQKLQFRDQDRGRPPTEADIDNANFPEPYQSRSMLLDMAKKLREITGGKTIAGKIEYKARLVDDKEGYHFRGQEDIALLKSAVAKLGKDTPWQIADGMKSIGQLKRAGIANKTELKAALKEYLALSGTAPKVDKIKLMERALIGANTGIDFFPTPKAQAKDIVDRAGITPGMRVLEPSAGTGNLAEEMRAQGGEVDVAEISNAHREILEAKGFNIVEHDFMDMKEGDYDVIVMNPPFSKNMDIEHVKHAYSLLKPGGKIVSIMGEGAFFRTGKTETEFREWLDEVGISEKLPEKFFMDKTELRTTGVNARIVEIDKPAIEEVLYSKSDLPPTQQATLDELTPKQRETIDRLRESGKLEIISNAEALEILQGSGMSLEQQSITVEGFFVGGKSFIVLDNIPKSKLWRTVLHEVGNHSGRLLQDNKGFKALLKSIETRMDEDSVTGKALRDAAAKVPADTAPEHRTEEILAYTVASGKQIGIVRRFIALLKNALVKLGISPDIFSADDFVALAEAAVRREARGGSSVNRFAQDAKFSLSTAVKSVTDNPAFVKWFGDSKVVNESGEPLVVYHLSSKEFSEFDTGQRFGDLGSHFAVNTTQSNAIGYKENQPYMTYPVYLNLKNPIRLVDKGDFTTGSVLPQLVDMGIMQESDLFKELDRNITTTQQNAAVKRILRKNGYDGVIYLNRREGLKISWADQKDDFEILASDEDFIKKYPAAKDSYIVLDPNQIKSIFNTGEFSATNPDIRFSTGQSQLDERNPPPIGKTKEELSTSKTARYAANRAATVNYKMRALRNAKKAANGVLAGIDKFLGASSTRLKNIHPKLQEKLRDLDYDTGTHLSRDVRAVEPMLQKAKKMSSADFADWDYARKNSDTERINELVEKYDMREEYDRYREVLDRLRDEANHVGMDIGWIKEYAPRVIADAQGFLNATNRGDMRPVISDAIARRAKFLGITVAEMTPEMKADIVSNMLFGGWSGVGKPGNAKERTIKEIPAELNQFYMDSDAALMSYLHSIRKHVEMRKFFGKLPVMVAQSKTAMHQAQARLRKAMADEEEKYSSMHPDHKPGDDFPETKRITEIKETIAAHKNVLDKYKNARSYADNISDYFIELQNEGIIKPEDESTLINVLNARFHEKGAHGFVQAYKNFSYMDTMGSPFSAITQIGDLAWTIYANGWYRTAKAAYGSITKKARISKEDVGIERIAQEFAGSDTLSNAVAKVFKLVGLEKMDTIGKEAFLNAALERFEQQATKDPSKLKKELQDTFEDETDDVINDLQNKRITDNVKRLVYGNLLDYQPAALSEMSEMYLKAGQGRVFYMLKSYTLKQFDVFRREVYTGLKSGDKTETVRALRNMVYLSALLVLANGSSDEIKDFMLGRKTSFEDRVIDNVLRLFGVSKFVTWKARTEGIGSAMGKQILPPFKFIDSAYKDISTAGDEKGLEIVNSIPVVGKLAYWHMGRGSYNRKDYVEIKFINRKKRLNDISDKVERNPELRRKYVRELAELKQVNSLQGKLNKKKKDINKLKALEKKTGRSYGDRIEAAEKARIRMIEGFISRQ